MAVNYAFQEKLCYLNLNKASNTFLLKMSALAPPNNGGAFFMKQIYSFEEFMVIFKP
jgi:hypothetical protein